MKSMCLVSLQTQVYKSQLWVSSSNKGFYLNNHGLFFQSQVREHVSTNIGSNLRIEHTFTQTTNWTTLKPVLVNSKSLIEIIKK